MAPDEVGAGDPLPDVPFNPAMYPGLGVPRDGVLVGGLAVCGSCHQMWQLPADVPQALRVGPGVEVRDPAIVVPCPACHANVRLPVELSFTEKVTRFGQVVRDLVSGASTADIGAAVDVLKGVREGEIKPDAGRMQLSQNPSEEVRRIADLVPRTRQDYYFVLAIIIAVLTLVITLRPSGHDPRPLPDTPGQPPTPSPSASEIEDAVRRALACDDLAPPSQVRPKPGRNAACPCGSGRKFKYCCAP